MNKTFTTEDLIKFYYSETPALEAIELLECMENDLFLNKEYTQIERSLDQLNGLKMNPSNKSVFNILRYSMETAVEC